MPTINYTKWPTPDDLEQFLIGANVWPSEDDQVASARRQAEASLSGAVSDLEVGTGYYPFLAGDEDETRPFTVVDEQGYLDLEGGLLSLTSVTVSGTAQTLNQQVFLEPTNAPSRRRPYEQLLFTSPYSVGGGAVYRRRNAILVTGIWGFCTQIPPDVWNAVLRKGAHTTLTSTNQDPDAASLSEDGFNVQFDPVGVIDPKTLLANLEKEFEKAVAKWKRVVC